jgi:hypothetical protein
VYGDVNGVRKTSAVGSPVKFTCTVDTTINLVVYQALLYFAKDANVADVPVDHTKYTMKVRNFIKM